MTKEQFFFSRNIRFHLYVLLWEKMEAGHTIRGLRLKQSHFLQKNTIETTGAGDTFTGCMLNTVLDKGLDNLTGEDIGGMLRFANAGAALITTKRGALRVGAGKR